jgi:hypothetical protein
MKIFKLILLSSVVFGMISCQKEINFDSDGASIGVFKKAANGDCSPATVNGVFKVDSVLNNNQYVDVQVDVTTPGSFEIKSDTVNGFSFRKLGYVVFGTNTIRLYPSGKPIVAGTNTFTISYRGYTCTFNITVVASNTGTSVFTIGGTPGTCTGATTAGTYTVGVPLTPANTITIQVNVTTIGTYIIGAASTSGFVYTGTGVFTGTGLQNVTLTGSGTPTIAGNAVITVSNITSNCTYNVNVLPGSGGGGGGGGTGSNYYFQFNDGTNLIVADTAGIAALMIPNSGAIMLSVQAFSLTADSAFTVSVVTTGNPQTGVTYNTNNLGIPTGVFNGISTTYGQIYEADAITFNQCNTTIKFDVIDLTNKIVSGTFSGTAKKLSGIGTITSGKFRAPLQ